MNTAARLEAANKTLGSTICFGEGAAERLGPDLVRPLGILDLRGRSGAQAVYEPWPADYSSRRANLVPQGDGGRSEPRHQRAGSPPPPRGIAC